MSSKPDDDPVMRSSTERYDRVGADLDWFIVLASATSIFFGFLLKIAVNPPSYFTILDDVNLLAALYALTVATAMFIVPLIYHITNFHRFQVDRFLFRTKQYVLIGIICVILATYLILGLLLTSELPIQFAYSLASLPFVVIILFRFFIRSVENKQDMH